MVRGNECAPVEKAREMIANPRYVIDEFIGSGAMSCVYKVSERGTPNIYAMKILREKYRQLEQFVEIFEREADYMRDLQYPNIVRFYKFVNEKNSAYILMDYVEGKPLTQEIRQARTTGEMIPLPKIVRIMAQIARAIHYLHSENVIHRDIKPGNILLNRKDESAYLTDLGITGAHNDTLLFGAGTPSYMPYEQQVHEPVTSSADIYAFAVMMFEVFTGQKPFVPERGMSFNDAREHMIALHRDAPVPPISAMREGLPESLDLYFEQALAKNPQDRYGDVMDFAKDIHEALREQLPPDLQNFDAIRPQAITRSVQLERRELPIRTNNYSNSVVIGGIAAILAIAALVILGLRLNQQTPPTPTNEALLITTDVATIPVTDDNSLTPTIGVVVSEMPNPSTATPTSVRATAVPTSTANSLDDEIAFDDLPTFPLVSDAQALGIDRDFNASLRYLARQGAGFVPLQVPPDPDGIRVQMRIADPQAFAQYGIAFAVQDIGNYWRFIVQPSTSTWLLEQYRETGLNEMDSGVLTDAIPTTLQVAVYDGQVQLLADGRAIISNRLPEETDGGYGLWLLGRAETDYRVDALRVDILGTSAERAQTMTPMPQATVAMRDLLLRDLQMLRASGDVNAVINCPPLRASYDGLSYHLDDATTGEAAATAQTISLLLYNACLLESGEIDFSDRFSDYLNWESALDALIETVQP